MTAEAQVESIINNAKSAATKAQDKAVTYSDQAQTAAVNIINLAPVPNPTLPAVVVPPFVNPNEDLGNEYKLEIAAAFADLDPKLTDDINDFLNTWFPDFANCLKTQLDTWICNTIQNGATGIPTAIENAIWQRSRERELQDAYRQEAEAVAEFASRGFSLPAGVINSQIQRIRQDAANKASTHSRDVAIKQAEIQIETIKFAVEQGIRLRLGIVTALIDFMRAKLGLYSLIRERAVSLVEAKRSLWQGAAAYYQALIAAAELQLKYDGIRIDSIHRTNQIVAEFSSTNTQSRVQAAVSAAEAMGDIAAAAFGSQNTLAEVAHNTISSVSS